MPSIYDIFEEERLKRIPVPSKPSRYRCAACEERDKPKKVRDVNLDDRYDYRRYDDYERYEHDYHCGYDNYVHIQWDYRKQEWVNTRPNNTTYGCGPNAEGLMALVAFPFIVLIIGIISTLISWLTDMG